MDSELNLKDSSGTVVDLVTVFSSLSTAAKSLLEGVCAARSALIVIQNDMSGYTSRNEAITMINSLTIEFNEAMKELNVKAKQTFVRKA